MAKKITRIVIIAVIALVCGKIIYPMVEASRMPGIRLNFGWLNNYNTDYFWGFPFATVQAPPSSCFCAIDTNPTVTIINVLIYAIIIFFILYFSIGLLKPKKK